MKGNTGLAVVVAANVVLGMIGAVPAPAHAQNPAADSGCTFLASDSTRIVVLTPRLGAGQRINVRATLASAGLDGSEPIYASDDPAARELAREVQSLFDGGPIRSYSRGPLSADRYSTTLLENGLRAQPGGTVVIVIEAALVRPLIRHARSATGGASWQDPPGEYAAGEAFIISVAPGVGGVSRLRE